MENKHGSGARAGSLGGKGFYIVLFLCAAVIGISAWMMLTDAGTNVEDTETAEENVVDVSGAYVTMLPADRSTIQQDVPAMSEAAEAEDTQTEETSAAETTAEPAGEEETTAQQEQPPVQEVFTGTVSSYIWPVQGTVERPYAVQTLLYDSTMADWRTHDGIDISCEIGSQVMAAAGGTVVAVSSDDLLGTMVEIDHSNGVHTIYANLAAEPPVAAGTVVTMGQVIGSVGSTALGEVNQVSHLHFAMREDGATVDPTLYLPTDAMQ